MDDDDLPPEDDEDALVDALWSQYQRGKLVLKSAVNINGLEFEAGEYRLTRVGPA